MKVLSLSDLHGYLPEITEKAEICCICGDIMPLNIQFNIPKSEEWLKTKFVDWVNALPVDMVFLIAGNHDGIFEKKANDDLWRSAIMSCPTNFKLHYLQDSYFDYVSTTGTYKIYGTPWCHRFGNWPFMLSDDELSNKWKNIPDNVDILMTHDPSTLGLHGVITQRFPYKNAGSEVLTKVILEKKPKITISGHIHSGGHEIAEVIKGIKVVNVSIKDENYEPIYKPLYFDI